MTEIRKIQQDYRRLAKDYERRWRSFLAAAHGWVLNRLEQPRQVIDLGCGTGLLLKQIHEAWPAAQLTGIDISPEMMAIARKRLPQATLKEEEISKISFEKQYDTVLSINVLHHLHDPAGHIGSLHRLCTENGHVFLSDFAIETLRLKIAEQYWRLFHPAHHKGFSREQLRSLITKYFIIEEQALLKPDRFWRLQIYKLRKIKDPAL